MGIILMDLSKAQDCLPCDLLAAKFEAYRIDKSGLNLIHDYLLNRQKITKIGSWNSDWYDMVRVVPQGLFLGPLFFNLFLNDLFLFIERTNICTDLEYDMQNIFKWFKVNSMKTNNRNSSL